MLGVDRWGGVHVDVHVLQVGRCTFLVYMHMICISCTHTHRLKYFSSYFSGSEHTLVIKHLNIDKQLSLHICTSTCCKYFFMKLKFGVYTHI